MLNTRYDIVIVSRFGSGHWLASQWASLKYKVLLIDLTNQMGPWPLEDVEGPFGHSRGETLSSDYIERFLNDDLLQRQESGWTFWLPEGPIEMTGPLSAFHQEKQTEKLRTSFEKQAFSLFSHFLASAIQGPQSQIIKSSQNALSLTAPLMLRHRTRMGHQKNIEWLERKNVSVITDSVIKDFAWKSHSEWSGAELLGPSHSGLASGDYLIWTLANLETQFLNEKIFNQLYSKPLVPPESVWVRYRFSVKSSLELKQVPPICVIIEDLDLPWSHSNFLISVKTTVPERIDIWILIPRSHRFQTDYLKKQAEKIQLHLESRFSSTPFELHELPQECRYTEDKLGPAQFSVWSDKVNRSHLVKNKKNIYFESIDQRFSYDNSHEFESQRKIKDQVIAAIELKKRKNEKEGKISVIERYTRTEMSLIWDLETKFNEMLVVEIAVAEVQAQLKMIPKKAVKDIKSKARINVKRISEIEKTTKHDVIAFVSNVAENVGPSGRYLHYGMTSSDVLDTAFSLQVGKAGQLIIADLKNLEVALRKLIRKHEETICAGRTHGMFAEPTTFGFKMAGFLKELNRNQARFKTALDQMMICKISGAVGTYSSQPPIVEKKVAAKLKLKTESIATQVVPRDRHAELIWSLSMIMSGLERLSIELRHLQRSEVSELYEGFTKGQKGSSAMPHKKNPISAENMTGLSRLVKGYALSAMENIPLWHERDISHSSVERVIFPDAFIVTDYALHRMAILIDGLDVNPKRMKENIESAQGQLFSSQVLLVLVQKGLRREEAYAHVQRLCHSLGRGDHLKERLLADSVTKSYFTKKELDDLFEGKKFKKSIKEVLRRVL